MTLKLAEAKRIIDGAIAMAQELKVEISVAVCNHEGRLIALNRMDGVPSVECDREAIGKAIASATWGARCPLCIPLRYKLRGCCRLRCGLRPQSDDGGLISTFEFSGFIQWLDLDQAAEGANALHSREREREI